MIEMSIEEPGAKPGAVQDDRIRSKTSWENKTPEAEVPSNIFSILRTFPSKTKVTRARMELPVLSAKSIKNTAAIAYPGNTQSSEPNPSVSPPRPSRGAE
jgi:hypothetical protein